MNDLIAQSDSDDDLDPHVKYELEKIVENRARKGRGPSMVNRITKNEANNTNENSQHKVENEPKKLSSASKNEP